MPKTKKITKLTKREKFLLNCTSENYTARALFISSETLRLWTELGLPFVLINGERFYNYDDIWAWIGAPSKDGDGSNKDMFWQKTPKHLLPQTIQLTRDFGDVLKGKYWVLPVDDE